MENVLTFVLMLIAATDSNTIGHSSQREPKHIVLNEKVLVGAAISGGAFSFKPKKVKCKGRRKFVFLPIALIQKAHNEGWEHSLSYFVTLKSLFGNNTCYDFSLRRLAEKVKCSPATLSKHLKRLDEQGLLRWTGKNLTFVGLKPLQLKYKNRNVGIPVNRKNQLNLLRAQIIRFNISAQKYKIRKSETQKQDKGNEVSLSFRAKTHSSYAGLSAAGIGKILGVSTSSGVRIRKKLNSLNIIKAERMYSTLCTDISYPFFRSLQSIGEIPRYAKYNNGVVRVERRMKLNYITKKKGKK